MKRSFGIGEVVYVEKYGYGVVAQIDMEYYLKIVFENGVDCPWWFTSSRVFKLEDVTKLQGE